MIACTETGNPEAEIRYRKSFCFFLLNFSLFNFLLNFPPPLKKEG